MTELSKKLIRLVVDELHDEKKGAPTIQDVITELNWAARDLERSALRLHIEKCIDEVFSDQICQPQQIISPAHIESKDALANAAEGQRGGGFRECRARGIRKNHPAISG